MIIADQTPIESSLPSRNANSRWPRVQTCELVALAAPLRSGGLVWPVACTLGLHVRSGTGNLFQPQMAHLVARARRCYSHCRALCSLFACVAGHGCSYEFLGDSRARKPQSVQWGWALTKTCMGILLMWVCARHVPATLPLLQGWIGLLALILLLHFGSFELIALGWQSVGVNAQAIMQQPLSSYSRSEFWGKRWNLGFRQLSHEFIFQPSHRVIGTQWAMLLVFLVSGLIHESVISLPARGGYGLPTAYFVLQGVGVLVERSPIGLFVFFPFFSFSAFSRWVVFFFVGFLGGVSPLSFWFFTYV